MALIPQNKSTEEIKAYWLERALSMALSPESTKALEPDMVQALAAAQQSAGPAVWDHPQMVEDAIREVLLNYQGEINS